MNDYYYYSSIDNRDSLELTSGFWLSHYNFLLSLDIWKDWQKASIRDAILSEKVFDV
jgi:hypothetical protein